MSHFNASLFLHSILKTISRKLIFPLKSSRKNTSFPATSFSLIIFSTQNTHTHTLFFLIIVVHLHLLLGNPPISLDTSLSTSRSLLYVNVESTEPKERKRDTVMSERRGEPTTKITRENEKSLRSQVRELQQDQAKMSRRKNTESRFL